MRILVLTPFLSYPLRHGGRIRSHHLLAALAARHDVVNVTGLAPDDDPADVAALERLGIQVRAAPLAPAFGALSARQRLAKLGRLLSGRSSLVPRFRNAAVTELVRRTAREGVDCCVLEQLWMAAYRSVLPRRPWVLSSQNVESLAQESKAATVRPGPGRWIARREAAALRRFEATCAADAARVVAVSEDDRARFLAMAPAARVAVVENGVDLAARPRLEAPSLRPLRLLYVGGYDYAPNRDAAFELATRILPAVRADDPEAQAVLVGRDPEGALEPLRGLPGVALRGPVPDLLPELRAASALVVPLRHGGGSRLKIVEAWAVGRPVVSTAVGAEGLGEPDGLPLRIAETAAGFAEALARLRDAPAACGELIDRARERAVARHDWSALGARFRALVEEAGKEATGSP